MSPDLFNGCFEFVGAVMLWSNVRRLYRDKETKGISIGPTAFFTSWGFWNLFYYSNLNQRFSFIGGANLVLANVVWLGQMIYYRRKNADRSRFTTTLLAKR